MCGLFQDPFGGANCAVEDASYDCPIPEGINLGRRTSVSAESMTSTQVQPQDVACFPKTESQEARLLSALRMNVLFQQMEPEIGSTLVQAMREKHVPKGGIVIKQGDDGKYCYVTESWSNGRAPSMLLSVSFRSLSSASSFAELSCACFTCTR